MSESQGQAVGTFAVPPVTGSLLVSCVYDATGLAYCMMFDNAVLAWVIDVGGGVAPQPVILGSMAPAPPQTAPVISPAWVVREGGPSGLFFVPDIARGTPQQMFTALATNNGAARKLYANFADPALVEAFKQWGSAHPDLYLETAPDASLQGMFIS